MAKKITNQDLSKIETTDAAFNQMMANLQNIDIDPYASERKQQAEEEAVASSSAEGGDRQSSVSGAAKTPRRSGRRKTVAKPASERALLTISEHGRDSLNLAKQLYCRFEGVRMSREEFLLMVLDNALKRLSPKAYEHWKYLEGTYGED